MRLPAILGCFAALNGAVWVALGASASHLGLDEGAQRWIEIATRYQIVHALAAFAALLLPTRRRRAAVTSAALFLLGALFFSGSLTAMAFGAPSALAMLTPVGGMSFIFGWIVLAWAATSWETRA